MYAPDAEIDFSGLDFYRLRLHGDKLIQIEFNQLVFRDPRTDLVHIDNGDGSVVNKFLGQSEKTP